LKEDLGLVKKSARWVPKLLSHVQKEERVRISQDFVDAVERSGLSMLDNIITMDETLVSYYTPETKRMSKEWTLKGKPGSLKAKVQASRSKQMVFAFFDSRGLIYTTGTTRLCIPLPWSPIGSTPMASSGSSTRRIHRILRWQTFSYLEKSERGWVARAWTRRPSRTPGRGSLGVSPLSTSPPPSEAGWSNAKSASASEASLSKNPKK
jgi:hypothetical protein